MNKLKKVIKELPKLFVTFKWCLSLSWDASKFFTVMRLAANIIPPILAIAASYMGKYVINLLAGTIVFENAYSILYYLLAGLLGTALIRAAMQKISQYCHNMHDDVMSGKLSHMLMEHSLSVDLEYFDNTAYHDKLKAAYRDSYSITYIVWNALSCISAVISFLGAFLVLSRVNFVYGIVLMSTAIPSSVAAAKYTKLLYRLNLEQTNNQRQMNYCETITTDRGYAQDMRLFNAGDKLKNRYKRIWNEYFYSKQKMARKRAILTGFLECLPEAVVTLIGVDIALNVLAGKSSVGDYSLYTGLASQLWMAIAALSTAVIQIYDNKMKIDNFKTIETFEPHVEDKGVAKLNNVDTIEFIHVCFTYPGTDERALDDLNFRLSKEQKVALVGLNGSGKTTLIKLLLRMYDTESGFIKINGRDIKEYSLSSLRSNFSVYFQDMFNYFFSLRENFTIADESHINVDKDCMEALTIASCDDILDKVKNNLDTSIGRVFDLNGIELSGGQHQKLALARALFRHHSVLVLDEPSSNLDPKAENDVFENLKKLTDGKMTIFTSHRLSNVFLADRIIVLEKGRLVEDGTQEQLIKNKKRYAELFKYQQDKYVERVHTIS